MKIPKADFKIGGDAYAETLVRNLPQKYVKAPIPTRFAPFLLDPAQNKLFFLFGKDGVSTPLPRLRGALAQ
ncbi:hypothetical protein LP420_08260 [Massilia sp. B-10]|nr:hypothetical protein LP420_08260 [Massilia sp. B-10]UUZ55536.1 hypothetical protein LP419_07790 [Massilia sp. H-1]